MAESDSVLSPQGRPGDPGAARPPRAQPLFVHRPRLPGPRHLLAGRGRRRGGLRARRFSRHRRGQDAGPACSPSRALTGSAGGGARVRWRARWRWRPRRSWGATASSSARTSFRWPVRWRRWRRSTPCWNAGRGGGGLRAACLVSRRRRPVGQPARRGVRGADARRVGGGGGRDGRARPGGGAPAGPAGRGRGAGDAGHAGGLGPHSIPAPPPDAPGASPGRRVSRADLALRRGAGRLRGRLRRCGHVPRRDGRGRRATADSRPARVGAPARGSGRPFGPLRRRLRAGGGAGPGDRRDRGRRSAARCGSRASRSSCARRCRRWRRPRC